MAIYGIEGGIGCGKTMTLVWFGLQDLYAGKTLYTNVRLKNIPKKMQSRVIYINKDIINNMFEMVKNKTLNMHNSTVLLQEAHNYIDSRNAASKKNRTFSYWILQSRHTGMGTCDIIYDTQDIGQIDLRLRRNTDYLLHPHIALFKGKKPQKIVMIGRCKKGQKLSTFQNIIDVTGILNKYDTHEIVEF